MGTLIERISLREKTRVFIDRHDAGRALAESLLPHREANGIVLAIPSGGVAVAIEVSSALSLPMDLIIVRKIQIPFNPEAGFGAVTPDGEAVFNNAILSELRLSEEELRVQVDKTQETIKRRNRLFRRERPYPLLTERNVILVDDGLASGYTMLAAVRFAKKMSPKRVIAAVPTGSARTVDFLLPEVDKLICLNVRSGYPFAVADAYRNWYDLTDEEVLLLLKDMRTSEQI